MIYFEVLLYVPVVLFVISLNILGWFIFKFFKFGFILNKLTGAIQNLVTTKLTQC